MATSQLCDPDLKQRMDELKLKARKTVYDSLQALPCQVSTVLKDLWDQAERKLDHVLCEPSFGHLLSAVTASGENTLVLLTALGHLNDRLGTAEQTIRDLRAELVNSQAAVALSQLELTTATSKVCEAKDAIAGLEAELANCRTAINAYKSQTGKLFLRQAAYMTTNKLVRTFMKGKNGQALSPSEACFYTLNNLRKAKATDKAALQQYLDSMPGLELGIDMLATAFVDVAHPSTLPFGVMDTQSDAISLEYLRECLEQECPDETFNSRPEVECVLDALEDLSSKLGESLFVSTKAPPKVSPKAV